MGREEPGDSLVAKFDRLSLIGFGLGHHIIVIKVRWVGFRLIPFVYEHRTDKKAISWGLYGLLAVIFRSLSAVWLSETPVQGVFTLIIFPLIIIGSIILYKIFSKKC